MLRKAHAAGLLAWDEQTQVVLRDRDAAQYLGGGWVEEYAGLKISGMRPDDWAPRLRIESADGHSPNELDAAVVHANRLLVIECKAAAARDNDVADWIYKAGRLAEQVGGKMAPPLLLSARAIGARPPPACARVWRRHPRRRRAGHAARLPAPLDGELTSPAGRSYPMAMIWFSTAHASAKGVSSSRPSGCGLAPRARQSKDFG